MFKGSGISNEKLIGGDKKGAHDPNREPLVSFSPVNLSPVPAVIRAMGSLADPVVSKEEL